MKVLLIVGGVLLLVLALLLFVAAIVVFFIARRRGAAAAPAHPAPAREPLQAPAPSPVAAPSAPPPPSAEPERTVMIDSRRQQIWGALHATTGPLAGRIFPVDPNGFYIGRDATQSQVVIESPSVSKRHLWVGVRNGAVMAIDQKSTNGTYLNTPETAIGEVRLRPGDTLILSDDVARFTYQA